MYQFYYIGVPKSKSIGSTHCYLTSSAFLQIVNLIADYDPASSAAIPIDSLRLVRDAVFYGSDLEEGFGTTVEDFA